MRNSETEYNKLFSSFDTLLSLSCTFDISALCMVKPTVHAHTHQQTYHLT